MPSFDFYCREHGLWEDLFSEYAPARPCPKCGEASPQVWLTAPNLDAAAARAWNGINDPEVGRFSDKSKYFDALRRRGSTIYEKGMDQEAEENNQRYLRNQEEKLKDTIGQWMADHTLDEVRGMIKAEAIMQDAAKRGDAETVRKCGGVPSLDEAMAQAPDRPVAAHWVDKR